MEENPKPSRRWFRFSLLAMLVALFCIFLAWAMNWRRQRHEFIEASAAMATIAPTSVGQRQLQPSKWMWLMGQDAYTLIVLRDGAEDSEIKVGKRLFPEALILDEMGMDVNQRILAP